MHDTRVCFALDNFIAENYFLEQNKVLKLPIIFCGAKACNY